MAERMIDLLEDALSDALPPSEVTDFIAAFDATQINNIDFWTHAVRREAQRRDLLVHPDYRLIDWIIDKYFGYDVLKEEYELGEQREAFKHQHPTENLWIGAYVWTSYEDIKRTIKRLSLSEEDVFYDLGAGYGRVPIYTGVVTDAQCRGVEMVPRRVETASQVIGRLGISNAEMMLGNVLEQDLSDGTAFYMYWPFSESTHNQVMLQLEAIAQDHPIRIAFRGGARLENTAWLRRGKPPAQMPSGDTYFYESV